MRTLDTCSYYTLHSAQIGIHRPTFGDNAHYIVQKWARLLGFGGNPLSIVVSMSSKQLLRIKEIPVDISNKLKQHDVITCKARQHHFFSFLMSITRLVGFSDSVASGVDEHSKLLLWPATISGYDCFLAGGSIIKKCMCPCCTTKVI